MCKIQGSSIVTYDIKINNKTCQCQVMCVDCGVCLHTLTCTCLRYQIGYVICKHIHFFCKKYNFSRNSNELSSNQIQNDCEGELVVDVEVDEYKERQSLKMAEIVSQVKKKAKNRFWCCKSFINFKIAIYQ